jgi:hypothetical protein
MSGGRLKVTWIDLRREPQCPPDPRHPDGVDLDTAHGAAPSCRVALPYPARRCGLYAITCRTCGQSAIVTTAGRPDDPRSITIACGRAR